MTIATIIFINNLQSKNYYVINLNRTNQVKKTNGSQTTNTAPVAKEDYPKSQNIQEIATSSGTSTNDELAIKDWNIKFRIPTGLSRVDYYIIDDIAYFYAIPKGYDVNYRDDFGKLISNNYPVYHLGTLVRSKDSSISDAFNTGYVQGKSVGEYYYYTAHSFSATSTGWGVQGLFCNNNLDGCSSYQMEAEIEALQLINKTDDCLLKTISES